MRSENKLMRRCPGSSSFLAHLTMPKMSLYDHHLLLLSGIGISVCGQFSFSQDCKFHLITITHKFKM